ncbi:Venom protein [Caenorhabditis elegans]|uniref:Venom protein n=2 Tax=Caenorhabditis elegans TaxID=6239 RepID=Q8MQ77_CAEEL|nr:Venom protein [Caenorhabditis elegans]CCD66915.1 Venom protein [Caenorhabditis elegans]|eukprot:NP_001041240.1 Uncharacterized protein CELE_F11C7.6 [Caenorhabditis elegans]
MFKFISMTCLVLLYHYCSTSPLQNRAKRAACDSTYGAWSAWGECSMNCGYCGKQNRTRTCEPVAGCAEPICSGDSIEIQSCGTSDNICFYPTVSCCNGAYIKTIDWNGKRFYCSNKTKESSHVEGSTDFRQDV